MHYHIYYFKSVAFSFGADNDKETLNLSVLYHLWQNTNCILVLYLMPLYIIHFTKL